MKVSQLFESESIDIEFIQNNFGGSYWEKADDMVTANWERDLNTLSDKQKTWVYNIFGDCIEKRIQSKPLVRKLNQDRYK